jgi:hypothetical protein
MKHIKLFEQFVNEGKVSYDKVAKALYGTTSQSSIPTMTNFLGIKSGDSVTIITVSLNQGSELFSYVTSLPKGTAWMSELSVFGSKTMYGAFKNMSQGDFNDLKSQFPNATVTNLDSYNSMKSKTGAVAEDKKISGVESVSDASTKY